MAVEQAAPNEDDAFGFRPLRQCGIYEVLELSRSGVFAPGYP